MEPLISVIVPVYKVEAYMRQCIDSIINQTYRNLEIILVDDGSPDNCGSICDEYAKKDKRIKVFHKKNGGLSDARNYGVVRTTGEYLSFVDSDDWIEPDMFELLVNTANRDRADLVNSGVYHNYSNRTVAIPAIEAKFADTIDSVKALIHGKMDPGAWGKIYRKSCISNIPFPCGHVFEEHATVYKFFLQAGKVVSIAKPLYHYRLRRKDAITETHTMANLYDYWLAHKSRYDYFLQDGRFNTDKKVINRLQYNCASAIAHMWRWCYENSAQEREQYASSFKEMQEFASSHFPCFGEKGWPLYLRLSIFLARFNNVFVFALLYYMNQVYRRVRG